MRKIKINKPSGGDELTSDMIKPAGPIGAQWPYRRSWTENKILEEWYKGIIARIYKK
jgi:hypothetical protein